MEITTARRIAVQYMKENNKSGWDGSTPMPDDVNELVHEYPLGDTEIVRIFFVHSSKSGWMHCCELVDSKTNHLKAMRYNPGVNSTEAIVRTLMTMIPV